jgi:hypothetical protein
MIDKAALASDSEMRDGGTTHTRTPENEAKRPIKMGLIRAACCSLAETAATAKANPTVQNW